jgi:hypothetical protein
MSSHRQQVARLGAYEKWSRTVNRSAATRRARDAAPGNLEYHLARLGPEFADATPEQRLDAAEAAMRAYFQRLAMRSAKARRRGGGPDAGAA